MFDKDKVQSISKGRSDVWHEKKEKVRLCIFQIIALRDSQLYKLCKILRHSSAFFRSWRCAILSFISQFFLAQPFCEEILGLGASLFLSFFLARPFWLGLFARKSLDQALRYFSAFYLRFFWLGLFARKSLDQALRYFSAFYLRFFWLGLFARKSLDTVLRFSDHSAARFSAFYLHFFWLGLFVRKSLDQALRYFYYVLVYYTSLRSPISFFLARPFCEESNAQRLTDDYLRIIKEIHFFCLKKHGKNEGNGIDEAF